MTFFLALQNFAGLYVGNNPRVQGTVAGSSALPPRAQNRKYGSHLALQPRKRVKPRQRKANFSLEGNNFSNLTFRDLL